MTKEKRHLYCLLKKSSDFEGLILTNVQQIIDYWHKITQCVFSWWHHWIVAIITIILLLNYLNPSFIWFSLCPFHLTRGKHQHNVLRDIISITTNTLHITPDPDSCHETRVEPAWRRLRVALHSSWQGLALHAYYPGPRFSPGPCSALRAGLSQVKWRRIPSRETQGDPATVGFETRKRAHARSLTQYGPGTGNKLDFSKNQNKSSPHGILRARCDSLKERLGLGVFQDE